MKTADFDYELPEELIAQVPVEPRDSSRLMIVPRFRQKVEHRIFRDLVEYLSPDDVLVVNDSRVMPARLFGTRRGTGAKIELLLLRPFEEDRWEVLAKPGRRVKPGDVIEFSANLSCVVESMTESGGRIVRFLYQGNFQAILETLGETPLPPYIHEQLEDKERYQTVYSRDPGSAAAPTAGLHFTADLLQRIQDHGVAVVPLTLHVGLGTFRPVQAENVEEHHMHSEFYQLSEESARIINEAKANGGRIIAVGTTAVRTLETLGKGGHVAPGSGWTDIFIYPGYPFELVDGMVTNFHLPCSSLLMLVSAFAGFDTIRHCYTSAVQERYRFFSFGDAMLLI